MQNGIERETKDVSVYCVSGENALIDIVRCFLKFIIKDM